MADISKIQVLSGETYDIKDTTARAEMSAAEIADGTGTTAKRISPANLKSAIETWAPVPTVTVSDTAPSSPSTNDIWFKVES